jgi:hypothetical protein
MNLKHKQWLMFIQLKCIVHYIDRLDQDGQVPGGEYIYYIKYLFIVLKTS